jgi:hypothetical protein
MGRDFERGFAGALRFSIVAATAHNSGFMAWTTQSPERLAAMPRRRKWARRPRSVKNQALPLVQPLALAACAENRSLFPAGIRYCSSGFFPAGTGNISCPAAWIFNLSCPTTRINKNGIRATAPG